MLALFNDFYRIWLVVYALIYRYTSILQTETYWCIDIRGEVIKVELSAHGRVSAQRVKMAPIAMGAHTTDANPFSD